MGTHHRHLNSNFTKFIHLFLFFSRGCLSSWGGCWGLSGVRCMSFLAAFNSGARGTLCAATSDPDVLGVTDVPEAVAPGPI